MLVTVFALSHFLSLFPSLSLLHYCFISSLAFSLHLTLLLRSYGQFALVSCILIYARKNYMLVSALSHSLSLSPSLTLSSSLLFHFFFDFLSTFDSTTSFLWTVCPCFLHTYVSKEELYVSVSSLSLPFSLSFSNSLVFIIVSYIEERIIC